jgi:hypothetical protein
MIDRQYRQQPSALTMLTMLTMEWRTKVSYSNGCSPISIEQRVQLEEWGLA